MNTIKKILQISNIFIKILDCYNWNWHFLAIDSYSFHRSFLLAMTNAASSVYGIASVVCSGICRRWGLVDRNTLQELGIRGCTSPWFELQCPNIFLLPSTELFYTSNGIKENPLESWDTLTSPKLFHCGVKGEDYNETMEYLERSVQHYQNHSIYIATSQLCSFWTEVDIMLSWYFIVSN